MKMYQNNVHEYLQSINHEEEHQRLSKDRCLRDQKVFHFIQS